MAKRARKSSGRCQCKRGKDNRIHCFKRVGRKIRGCKRPR